MLIKSRLELQMIDGSIEIVRMLTLVGFAHELILVIRRFCWVSRCKGSVAVYVFIAVCAEGKKSWEEMQARRIKPDVVASDTVIAGFGKTGEKAEEILREMELSGVESTCMITFEHLIMATVELVMLIQPLLSTKICRKDFRPEASTMIC
ncbi:hypothetical protein P3X46_032739 [Hevea brasiliensis]|uniref:Pentatricopeptide repeat-containing protein n=1 Tax=Hevea brasiliensis TaxID=3981 RepID=A0ABQ9KFF3_HEVBR|nr:hypothetical protein P3X46_032739 [Hevea brasiliensis]